MQYLFGKNVVTQEFCEQECFSYDENECRRTVCTSREFEEVWETIITAQSCGTYFFFEYNKKELNLPLSFGIIIIANYKERKLWHTNKWKF